MTSLRLLLSLSAKAKLGVQHWKLNPSADAYPVKAVPWNPQDAKDPQLAAIRDVRGYSYADIITVHPDHLPEFDTKVWGLFVGLGIRVGMCWVIEWVLGLI